MINEYKLLKYIEKHGNNDQIVTHAAIASKFTVSSNYLSNLIAEGLLRGYADGYRLTPDGVRRLAELFAQKREMRIAIAALIVSMLSLLIAALGLSLQ